MSSALARHINKNVSCPCLHQPLIFSNPMSLTQKVGVPLFTGERKTSLSPETECVAKYGRPAVALLMMQQPNCTRAPSQVEESST